MDAALIGALRPDHPDPTGHRLLTKLTEDAGSGQPFDPIRASTTLRKAGHSPDLISAAITQATLRARGQHKFGRAALGMFFTPDGLEQATRPEIAARHADRFAAAEVGRVWDLGSGIGSDALAMVTAGLTVTAVERDPSTAAVAAANLDPTRPGGPCPATEGASGTDRPAGATVLESDVEQVLALPPPEGPRSGDGLWFDPARRIPGVADVTGRTRRTFRLDQLAPTWDLIRSAAGGAAAAGAKLSPAMNHAQVPGGAQAEWISFGGSVLECAIWWGAAAVRPGRSAAVHTSNGWISVHEGDGSDRAPSSPQPTSAAGVLGQLGPWLYEADPAVRSAGLVGILTARVDGHEIGAETGAGTGWVSSEHSRQVEWARRFRLLDSFPFRPKTFRGWIRRQGLRELTIRTRGVGVDAQALWRQMPLDGDGSAVVLIIRVGGTQQVLHLDPCS